MSNTTLTELQVSVRIHFPETGVIQTSATSTRTFWLTKEELTKLAIKVGTHVLQYWNIIEQELECK